MSEAQAATPPSEAKPADHPLAKMDRSRVLFRADYLHALEPIVRSSQERIERFNTAGLIVEPVESGGAVLIATDGRCLAALFDKTAHATRAMRLTIPDEIFERAAPQPGRKMWDQGESFEVPPPEWMQPGTVWAFALGIFVAPKMHIPGVYPSDTPHLGHASAEEGNVYAGGFRLHPEPPTLRWRDVLAAERQPPAGHVNIYPQFISKFERIERLFQDGMQVGFAGAQQALLLTIPGSPEFVGAFMPRTNPIVIEALPTWAQA